jgi:hypothetical protein
MADHNLFYFPYASLTDELRLGNELDHKAA